MERRRFRDTYRIEPARLLGWDYAAAGWYFVTMCTKDRVCCLCDVVNGEVRLSEAGRIVKEEWYKTEEIRPYVRMDAFIIMPNHVHGIIGIRPDAIVETPRRGVFTALADTENPSRLSPHSLGAIIGQIKSVATKRIRAGGFPDFAWQPRFYDHVIRTGAAHDRIRYYIRTNPADWHRDPNHPDRL